MLKYHFSVGHSTERNKAKQKIKRTLWLRAIYIFIATNNNSRSINKNWNEKNVRSLLRILNDNFALENYVHHVIEPSPSPTHVPKMSKKGGERSLKEEDIINREDHIETQTLRTIQKKFSHSFHEWISKTEHPIDLFRSALVWYSRYEFELEYEW